MANRPRRSLTESAAAVSRSANALDTQDADRLERDAAAKATADAQVAAVRAEAARAAAAATQEVQRTAQVSGREGTSSGATPAAPVAAIPVELARRLPIGEIKLRDANTRPLNLAHVIRLAESIMVLGIIEDIVIDQEGVLVDGGHRHAASTLLACMAKKIDRSVFCALFPDETPAVVLKAIDRFSMHETLGRMPSPEEMVQREHDIMEAYADHIAFGVPVTRRMITDPAQRLGMEVAANEHRRNYTGEEIRGIADRLRNAGYVEKPGRPREGEKSLRKALETVIGRSYNSVLRLLYPEKAKATPKRDAISFLRSTPDSDLFPALAWAVQRLAEAGHTEDLKQLRTRIDSLLPPESA